MRIAIVEDEAKYREQLQTYLQNYVKDYDRQLEVFTYSSGVEFLRTFKGQFDLILLDVSMPQIDGMETARQIRKLDTGVCILFVTNMAQYAIRGYEVDASDYILKPITYFSFSQRLNRAISRLNRKAREYLVVNLKDGPKKLDISSIYYVESCGHSLTFHTADGDYTLTGIMKEVEQRLAPYHFARCNNGYLVSLQHVDGVKSGCAVVNGEQLMISRPRKNSFMEMLTNYFGGMML